MKKPPEDLPDFCENTKKRVLTRKIKGKVDFLIFWFSSREESIGEFVCQDDCIALSTMLRLLSALNWGFVRDLMNVCRVGH